MVKNCWTVHFTWVIYVACEFYLSKAVINNDNEEQQSREVASVTWHARSAHPKQEMGGLSQKPFRAQAVRTERDWLVSVSHSPIKYWKYLFLGAKSVQGVCCAITAGARWAGTSLSAPHGPHPCWVGRGSRGPWPPGPPTHCLRMLTSSQLWERHTSIIR